MKKRGLTNQRRAARAARLRRARARRWQATRDNHTRAELKDIALAIHHGRSFCDRQCRSAREIRDVWQMVFAFMDRPMLRDILARYENGRGLLVSDMRSAMPLGVNGLPMFHAVKVLNRREAAIVDEFIGRIQEAERTLT